MGHGGKRPRAGRRVGSKNKKTLERAALRAVFEAQATAEFQPILEAYFARAKGEPSDADPRILIDLFNRLLGKPAESVELSAPAGAVRIVMQQEKA